MAKLSEMSLPELYDRKVTATVEKVILKKEDFTRRAPGWCDKVCKLKVKSFLTDDKLTSEPVDVLIIQDFSAFGDRFKSGESIERSHRKIIEHLATEAFKVEGVESRLHSFDVITMLKCPLAPEDIKKGKQPTDTILSKCKPYFLTEIALRKPKVIISLSTSVTKAMGFKQSNARDCGDILSYEGIPVILTLHPRVLLMLRQNASGVAWGPDFFSIIANDFNKAAQVLRKENPLKTPDLDAAIKEAKTRIHIARSEKQALKMCEQIRNAGAIMSFDTETTGLDPFDEKAKIILMQFGFRDKQTGLINAYVFPMWHRANVWYNPDDIWPNIRDILLDGDLKKVGHNMKFDMLYTEVTLGVRIQGVMFDTMLLMHSINSGLQGMYGLKRAVGNWLAHSGLQGYEDKLPKLTRIGKKDESIGGNNEGSEEDESGGGDAH